MDIKQKLFTVKYSQRILFSKRTDWSLIWSVVRRMTTKGDNNPTKSSTLFNLVVWGGDRKSSKLWSFIHILKGWFNEFWCSFSLKCCSSANVDSLVSNSWHLLNRFSRFFFFFFSCFFKSVLKLLGVFWKKLNTFVSLIIDLVSHVGVIIEPGKMEAIVYI